MALSEKPIFGKKEFRIEGAVLDALLQKGLEAFPPGNILYFSNLDSSMLSSREYPFTEIHAEVDNFFTLSGTHGFEQVRAVFTLGVRSSRFAPLILWEIFHILAVGGMWLDIDEGPRNTVLSELDYLERDYYKGCLSCHTVFQSGNHGMKVYHKTASSLIGRGISENAWSFGILTAGPSENAKKMVETILSLDCELEIILCGPMPKNLPEDRRIRRIDLEKPEPRGWITKKKNMIVDAAAYQNLCIMHDRFVFPSDFLRAMERYGRVFSFLTFPSPYFPESSGISRLRYADYQVIFDHSIEGALEYKVFHGSKIFHPSYHDFHETAFCCGGVYVTKKALWDFVRQDESLYHCEWEDAVFGLESQKKGIPHRINPYTCFESTNPHPLMLTRILVISPDLELKKFRSTISAVHEQLAASFPGSFKPIIQQKRLDYYQRVATRYNAMSMVKNACPIEDREFANCTGLSDFWQVVYGHVVGLPVKNRDELLEIYALFSMIYNWPNGLIQWWIRNTEMNMIGKSPIAPPGKGILGRIRTLYRSSRKALRPLRAWYLQTFRPRRSLPFDGSRYAPFADMIFYFQEVEKYYPVIFLDSFSGEAREAISMDEEERRRLLDSFMHSDIARETLFVERCGERLPPLDNAL